eukprot:2681308-Prymnesium_polylepis.1
MVDKSAAALSHRGPTAGRWVAQGSDCRSLGRTGVRPPVVGCESGRHNSRDGGAALTRPIGASGR